MNDLVKQLRDSDEDRHVFMRFEAADEIERLQARVAELETQSGFDHDTMTAIRDACHVASGGNCAFIDDDVAKTIYDLLAQRDSLQSAVRTLLEEQQKC